MKYLIPLSFPLLFLIACQKQEAYSPPAETFASAKTMKDVPYGIDAQQKMDIYLPAGRTTATTKAMVLIHGGGWTGGDKEEFNLYIDTFKKRLPGYALFNINYRVYNGNNRFPTQEQDVHAAVSSIISKAAEYGINKDQLVLTGASAGAHLALLEAYKYKSSNIQAVVDYFGPTDLLDIYENPWHPLLPAALQVLTGATPEANPDIYIQSSPITFVDPQSPPTLIMHGTADTVVLISQSQKLDLALKASGVPHEFASFQGETHRWWQSANMSHSFDRIVAFLKEHLP
ncbi:MAG: prolyl oligopeptidase family serine peptidase [Flavisolibacter sp.]